MTDDLIISIINNAFQELVNKFKVDGLSDLEIESKVSEQKIDNIISETTEAIVSDTIDTIKSSMYEEVLEARHNTEQFMAHNDQIWGKGFIVSEAMYIIALEAGSNIRDYILTIPEEQYKAQMYSYCVLGEIYKRACQQYLEITYLVKGGFADGAYARWRSIFELSVISKFIRDNGEAVAKAYYDASFTDDGRCGWAGVAPCFSEWKNPNRIRFEDIKEQCDMSTEAWDNQYRQSNKVVHTSPQGTFDRLGMPSDQRDITPVGHSVYGLAAPAVNAAISLAIVATNYFGFVSSGESIIYEQILVKWVSIIKEQYIEIESTYFNNKTESK